jgi:uncharacterized protein YdiU (UPF0061 family)
MVGMCAKIGLTTEEDDDHDIVDALFATLEGQKVDYTLFFRNLSHAARGDFDSVRVLFDNPDEFDAWAIGWQGRLSHEDVASDVRAAAMNRVNPIYVPRNHKVEEALAAASNHGDLEAFKILLEALKFPFDERPKFNRLAEPAPADFGEYKTFCGT